MKGLMYLYMEIVSIYSTLYQRFNSDNGEAHLGAIVFLPFIHSGSPAGSHCVPELGTGTPWLTNIAEVIWHSS